MKTALARFITLVALFSLFADSGHADSATHTQIIKEREAVLSELVAYQAGRFDNGTGDEEALTSAQVALCSFRRDTAATIPEKIKQQELIVKAYGKKLARLEERMKIGMGSRLDILTSTDVLLQAKQLLEELRLSALKPVAFSSEFLSSSAAA